MQLLSAIELPHWLMIAGAGLVAIGFIGLALARNRETATKSDSDDDSVESLEQRLRMPPMPPLLDSSRRKPPDPN